jgi:predicted PurR-regulated permease PerM
MTNPAPNTQPRLITLAAFAALIAVFYFGREVLIPFALAVLLSFLLAPLVRRVEGWGIRRVMAVGLVVLLSLAPVAVLGWMVAAQFVDLAETLPKYQGRIEQKLESIKGPAGGAFSRITTTLRDLNREASLSTEPATEGPAVPQPTPVRIVSDPIAPVELVRGILRPVVRPLATAGIVIVFVLVILIRREDLRDRLIRLIGPAHLTDTTHALDELSTRVSRFLRMQFVVNLTYGIAIAIGLMVIGIPGAFFWGFMCMTLRFIPYLGPIIAAGMPIALSLAISEGWTLPIETALFFIIVELISNNVVEPWLYGKKTGVSVLAVLFAAVFWTWLWGLPGLFLSTPMTVCLVVAGRYVPQLAFLDVLLGDQPVLSPGARIYQRLLAQDSDEAVEVAEAYLAEHSLEGLYDDVLVEVLGRMGQERDAERLDPLRERLVAESLLEIIDETALRPRTGEPGPPVADLRTLCIPARDDADAAGARMLANLLASRGLTSRALSLEDLGSDPAAVMSEFRPDLLLVSAAQPHASARARLRVRQLLLRAPGAIVMVGLWGGPPGALPSPAHARLKALGAREVFTTLSEASGRIAQLATLPSSRPDPAPTPG